MSIQYAVNAEIFDIGQTLPIDSDNFLIDSNIWFWMTYSKSSYGNINFRQNIMNQYANYVGKVISCNAKICCSGLSLSELSHIIEKTELNIHNSCNPPVIKTKEFRHNYPLKRSQVVKEIQTAWSQVTNIANSLSVNIDISTSTNALNRLQTEKIDGYDVFILESMKGHNVVQVITDDGDFATVSGIQVFTANRNVLQAAKSQNMLKTR